MNFQRNNSNPYETLKVGRKANAVKVKSFEIRGEVIISLIPEKITDEMRKTWKIQDNTISFVENFIIEDFSLITALIILKRDGICRDFNDFMHELILKRFWSVNSLKKDFPIDDNKEIDIRTKWVLIIAENGEEFEFTIGKKFQLTFNRTGLDLIYRNELYRIAPPKDGALPFTKEKK